MNATVTVHAWRSLLFLPQFAFAKASSLEADCLIVDLQDAVPLHLKKAARAAIVEASALGHFARANVIVRVNELALEAELEKDLDAIVGLPDILGVMPTMAVGAACIDRVATMILAREIARGVSAGGTRLLSLVETPEGLLNALPIARAGHGRHIGLLYGSGDLLRLSGAKAATETTQDFPRNMIVHAARAAGIEPFDTPWVAVEDAIGLAYDARAAKMHGFTGKACVHPSQLHAVNRILAPSSEEIREARAVLRALEEGRLKTLEDTLAEDLGPSSLAPRSSDAMAILDGRVVGPPHVKAAKSILARARDTTREPADSVVGRAIGHAIAEAPHQALELPNPYELTITAGARDLWLQTFYTHDRIATSAPFAKRAGYTDDDRVPLPFLMSLYLACCMSSTHGAIFHLGFRDGRQHRPIAVGDTVRQRITLKEVRNVSDGRRAVVRSHRELVRVTDAEVVFSLDKLELYARQPEPFGPTPAQLAEEHADRARADAFRDRVLGRLAGARSSGAGLAPDARSAQALTAGDLLLHGFARPMGTTANLALSTLFLVTHPIHLDHQRFDHGDGSGVVVSGGLVVALAASAAARDLHEVLWEELVAANNVGPLAPGETLGAMSYVVARVAHAERGYEELVVKTLGVRNMTPSVDLAGVELPRALFTAGGRRAVNYDALCRKLGVPELEGRVVCELERHLIRALPVA
jgi:citrate lyase beta subunit/acyl dehydratase